jgi:hypothetical protein
VSYVENIDEHTIALIASRVATAIRGELEAIAAELGTRNGADPVLTVDDVAARLGVARSTVYAHWREWGGYKLGTGEKAALRFHPSGLPEQASTQSWPAGPDPDDPDPPPRAGRPRAVIRGEPRLPTEFDGDPPGPDDTPNRGSSTRRPRRR